MIDWWNSLSFDIRDAVWTIGISGGCAIGCGLLGNYLVLQRLSLFGDAISHAILPGLVIALIWSGSTNPLPMLLGAMGIGLLTALLTNLIQRVGNVPGDSSMGVVFTTLFAWGVILINQHAEKIHFDADCVLYGSLDLTVLNVVLLGGIEVPKAFLTMMLVLSAIVLFILLFWKELKISSFDAALATSMGINAMLMHYLLMSMVAASTVTSFESVGSILVIAMLIAPAATAHMLTDRLKTMMFISALAAFISAACGYFLALWLNTSVAGMIAVVAGIEFGLAAIFSPRHGVIGRWCHNLQIALRIIREDALAMLWRHQEQESGRGVERIQLSGLVGGGWMTLVAIRQLMHSDQILNQNGILMLTDQGMTEARRLMQGHRLWETYLTDVVGRDPDIVDESAHRVEHFLSDDTRRRLDDRLQSPDQDPHGKQIPR
jgi:manganese/zinc/iron transport system permease protein